MKSLQWILIISSIIGLAVLSVVVVKRTKKQTEAPENEAPIPTKEIDPSTEE